MRTILTALILAVAMQAGAECGKLCNWDWWQTATETDLQDELDAGAEVTARSKDGRTPLHYAMVGAVENVQILI